MLVFENRDAQGMRVAAGLKKCSSPDAVCVVTASDLPALRRLLRTRAFAAVIIEVGREAGDALAALRLLGKGDPVTPLYVYNGFMLPRIADKSAEYEQMRYFDDHANFDRFLAMILDELARKKRGIIHGIALGSFLQLMNSEKFSGQIIVTTEGKKGVLFLLNGQLLGASVNDSRQDTALAEMSEWQKVTVEIMETEPAEALAASQARTAAPPSEKTMAAPPAGQPAATGHIDTLRFELLGKKVILDIKKLNAALVEVQDLLADHLVRMDIFLSANGRSLAGWNSQPLACSAFAAVTRSVMASLRQSTFPRLRHYYLLDLADEHTAMIMTENELQWGMLLRGAKRHMGLLLNVVLPIALKALTESRQNEH